MSENRASPVIAASGKVIAFARVKIHAGAHQHVLRVNVHDIVRKCRYCRRTVLIHNCKIAHIAQKSVIGMIDRRKQLQHSRAVL